MYRHIKTNFVQFLNFVESRFPPKKFYNIGYWFQNYLISVSDSFGCDDVRPLSQLKR